MRTTGDAAPAGATRAALAAAAGVFATVHGAASLLTLAKEALSGRKRNQIKGAVALLRVLAAALLDASSARLAAAAAAGALSYRLLAIADSPQLNNNHTIENKIEIGTKIEVEIGNDKGKRIARTALRGAAAAAWLALAGSPSRRAQIALILVVRSAYYAVRALIYAPAPSNRTTAALDKPNPSTPVASKTPIAHTNNDHRVLQSNQDADFHRRHGHLVLREFPKGTPAIVPAFAAWTDRFGLIPIWIVNAFIVCRYSLVEPIIFSKAYFNSLMAATSSSKRYGPDYKQVVGNLGLMFRLLANRPANHPMAVIPSNTDTSTFLTQWINDANARESSSGITTNNNSVDGITDAIALNAVQGIRKAIPAGIQHHYLGCCLSHPRESTCEQAAITILINSLSTFSKAYSVINGAFLLLHLAQHLHRHGITHTHSKNTLMDRDATNSTSQSNTTMSFRKALIASLNRFVRATAQSAVSLSMFVTMFLYSICICRRVSGRERLISFGIAGIMASPSMFLENPSRIAELNIYVSMKTLEGIWSLGVRRGWWRYIPRLEMVAAIPASALLAVVFEHYPYATYGVYAPIIRSYFGIKSHAQHYVNRQQTFIPKPVSRDKSH